MQRHLLFSTLRSVRQIPHSRLQTRYGVQRILSVSKRYSSSCTELKDEYNDSGYHAGAYSDVFRVSKSFQLESGRELDNVEVAYTTYGTLNAARDNAVVVCHALTGQSQVHQWWENLVTEEWTNKYFLVCANVIGSCYGTTGPTSIDPSSGKPYGASFPTVTVRDAVHLQIKLLQEELGVQQVRSVLGGSIGGAQALEWAFLGGPEYVKTIVPIACNSYQTAWRIGINEVQRQAIYRDPRYQNGHYNSSQPPFNGLGLARQIAMLNYRTHAVYNNKYGRDVVPSKDDNAFPQFFQVQSYLNYQGEKFINRFDANAYITLTNMIDSHDVGRGRGGVINALSSLKQPAMIMGIVSDVLYPVTEQQYLAQQLPNGVFQAIETPHGHDGFLLDQDTVSTHALRFIEQQGF